MKDITVVLIVNDEKSHLTRALESIYNQSDEDFKIIIVNNSFSNNNRKLINEFVDDRTLLINKERENINKTRNDLLKEIRTKYFLFLNPDHYLNVETIRVLKEELDQDYDLIRYQFCKYRNGKMLGKDVRFKNLNNTNKIKELSKDDYLESLYLYLFNLRFIKDNNLKFNEELDQDDYNFIIKVLSKSEKTKVINDSLYNFSKDNRSDNQKYLDYKKQYQIMIDYLEKESLKNKKVLEDYLTRNLLKKLRDIDLDLYKEEIKDLKNHQIFNKLNANNFKDKFKNYFIKLNPRLFSRWI